jgi:D-glycero-alpha-D-manno-heptose-7-phosphate kinase
MHKKIIRSRAPLRITFGGGSTDHSPYDEKFGGLCVNATINKYAYVTLKINEDESDKSIKIISEILDSKGDYNPYEQSFNSIEEIYLDNGILDLIKATIIEMKPVYGFDLYVRSEVPPHSGLGASAAICIATIGVFNHLREIKLKKSQIAELTYFIENEKIKNRSGRQDPYAVVFGGIKTTGFHGGDKVTINKITISERHLLDLEKSLIILNQKNRNRASGEEYNRMFADKVYSDEDKLSLLHGSKEDAIAMNSSLQNTNLRKFGKLILEVWKKKKQYNPLSTDDKIEQLTQKALSSGAIGLKLMGGGGGGHLLVYCEPDKEHKVKIALENLGAKSLDFSFDHEGLKVWEADE